MNKKDLHKRRSARIAVILVLLGITFTIQAGAQETTPGKPYSGDFWSRSTLTGDWGGIRNDLARKGVMFDMSVTQMEQGVVGGGKNSNWEYGGRANLTLNLDTQKMGLWPGGFLTVELEQNWSEAVNAYTGSLMPVNSNQLFPASTSPTLAIPQVSFIQFLSEYFGVMVGKVDTMTGSDTNEFAPAGKGDTRFMNLAFNVNPALLALVPYSTLAAGAVILPTKDPAMATVTLNVMSAVGNATTIGFDNLSSDKMVFAGEGRIRTDFFGKTGHQLVGGVYSNKDFTSFDQRFISLFTYQLETESGSWAVYYNFDQYFYEPVKGSGRGIGIFGRFGAADKDTNPVHYAYSLGIGGKGVIPGRPNDSFGLGWFYIDVSNPRITMSYGSREFLRNENAFEAYYNIALTPWLLFTPDIQIVRPAQKKYLDTSAGLPVIKDVDMDYVLGLRLQILL